MPHALEIKYGLTAQEMLDAIDKRFRLKVALEGAIAEVHFERKLKIAAQEGWIESFEGHDTDGMHDFTVATSTGRTLRFEVKTIRNGPRPKVEIQKTRTSNADPSSRFYSSDHFDVVAVCVGRFTGDWSQFRYVFVRDLPAHRTYPEKIGVMHDVPLPETETGIWMGKLQEVFDAL